MGSKNETTNATLRIAFVGMKGLPPDLPGAGGGERETDAKARRLAERGHEITVYCRWGFVRHPPSPYYGIRLVSLPALRRPGMEMLSHTPLATLHAILTDSADVISYHGMGNALFLPLAKLGGKKTVVYMDGIDWERPKWGWLARVLLKQAASAAFRWGDVVYVDNRVSQQEFARIFGKTPRVITLGADIWQSPGDDLLSGFGLQADQYILFVGMLRPDKGVHLLVEAYSKLKTSVPLVIVGENPDDPDYVSRLKEHSGPRVRFLGYQYGTAARQLFANCLIYVQPSVMEGNSPALMSAMACGRCVVVNGIEQNLETVGDAGLACAPGDTDHLSHILQELLSNPERIEQMGAKAEQRIRSIYSWDAVVDRLERLYLSLGHD